ncbi:hypothetical protein [Leptolyngbya sp. Heron Island J]|uniref:hypothetical protein n=1 Tax=Leptolyngbya sp. Heron Island J TaxID=1385935 RepID=UPI0013776750|nr:hypothetical protein [Leptolyngbya sp. Heron Island J]
MATLTLIKVDIIPSPTCPNTVSTEYRFLGGGVGSPPYSVPKGPSYTFPGGGATLTWSSGAGKLYLYIDGQLAHMGNGIIGTNPTSGTKVYNSFCNYGTFKVTYKVT